jgi:hypothetical protein
MKKGSKPKVISNVVSQKPFPPVNAPDPINAKIGTTSNLRRIRDYSKKGK